MDVLEQVHGTAIQRAMLPWVQSILLYGLEPLVGIERMKALPHVLGSDEALMRLVGFNAQQVRQGSCQRGVTTRQGARPAGRLGADTLAKNIVKLHLRELEAVLHGAIRALANTGGFGAKVTGIAAGPAPSSPKPGPIWALVPACPWSSVIRAWGIAPSCGGWDQHALIFVVPATANMAVTADVRAQAAAQEGLTIGRRVQTVCHGQGRGGRAEQLETEVMGSTGLTPCDPDGTPEHGRSHTRRDLQANAIHAVAADTMLRTPAARGNERGRDAPAARLLVRQIALEPVAPGTRVLDKDPLFGLGWVRAGEVINVTLARASGPEGGNRGAVILRHVSHGNQVVVDVHAMVKRASRAQG